MKVLVSIFLAIALLLGPAACTEVETREQRFANTEKKAARGDPAALYNLGLMYEQGYGVAQDKYQAAWCYRKAAEKGHVQAQNHESVHRLAIEKPQERREELF